jgi:hypothetical protein
MSDGTWFAGNHGPEGDWKTLKGRMLAPHEAAPMESSNTGDPRFNGEITGPQGWEASIVQSGPFDPDSLTRGGGTMAK